MEKSEETKMGDESDILTNDMDSISNSNSMWLHLIGKPSKEDLLYEQELQCSDPLNHIAMTTRQEIWAWYLFDVARTPLTMYSLGLIYPLYLSILATRYACLNNVPYQCDYYNKPIGAQTSLLAVHIGSWSLKPESYATLMISFSGILQLIGYLWLSSIADYSNYQSYAFRISFICADIMVISYFFIPEQYWLFAGIYGAILLVPLGLAAIFYNAYLPVLVENHWLIRRLQRKYKNKLKSDEYYDKHKKLIQCIQDDISQYGYMMGYISGFIAGIFVGIGLFLLEDITTEISDIYGVMNDNINEEYWMKPVIGIDIWHSNIINESYINGIRFTYGDIYLNGSIYGASNISEFSDNINVSFFHSSYKMDEQYNVIQINLFQNSDAYDIDIFNGIQFICNNDDMFTVGDISNEFVTIKPNKYPNYGLSGYKINDGIYNDIHNNISLPIINGFQFAFMDINKGQFGDTLDNRLLYSMGGVWSILFAIPAFIVLKSRKKRQIPKSSSICTVSCTDYYNVFGDASKYPYLFRCLMAWFIWSDAQNTTSSIGVLFSQNELNMNAVLILILLLELQFVAVLGTIFFVWIAKKFNLTNKNLLVLHLSINMLLPIWAIFGLFDWSFGLIHIWEMFVFVGLFYGSQWGSLASSSRSLYAHLTPIGRESQFFGLYEVTNKGSSWIGPLLATFISNSYSLRYALIYVVIFYVISIPIVQFGVNYNKGMIQSGKAIENIKKPLLEKHNHHDNNDDISQISVTQMTASFESYHSQK